LAPISTSSPYSFK